ncbi:hypothetical protein [Desulfofustis glycolicus]|uniref:Polysaccharide lyase n=1 Tax=Desulfofustis glycolicus DSM 9705 TaxID=1121409 RepID=A0A1M5WA44_9BACT|nr:hypothetical protein [Desulfofustis glycolicus]SHH84308.1 hypothetical protein SAMN02745124_02189 [Desulfofustis glycolicus DSM 9705]
MKKSILLFSLILIFFCNVTKPTFADPIISKVTGTVKHGDTIYISGDQFGHNDLNYSFIGFTVDETTVGSRPVNSGGWVFDEGGAYDPTVSSDQYHSGGKSLRHEHPACCNSTLKYDYGKYIALDQTVFVSWWTRASWSTDGQWKMFRINWRDDIQDDAPQMTMFNWTNSSKQFMNRPGPTTGSAGTDNYMNQVMSSLQNTWYRHDLIINLSSFDGNYDGSYTMLRYQPGDSVYSAMETNKMTHNDPPQYWRWFLWQNYAGNNMTGFEAYLDDNFIQVGSQARIELCDDQFWENRTSCEIQLPLSWSTTYISSNVNSGSFNEGDTAYLYVIDELGIVNSEGFALTVGQTADITVIEPPIDPRLEN